MNQKATVQLFAGSPMRIDEEGQFSAIVKHPVSGAVHISKEGLSGDAQADRRVHGGPEKAVHQFAGENYTRLAAQFPGLAEKLVPGSIGENISSFGFDETTVCIGDIFQLGSAMLQVSQPRRPCWKIDWRYASQGVTAHIVSSGLTGWYYRVLEEGTAETGDPLTHVERPAGTFTLDTLWQAWHQHRPDHEQLAAIASAPGLTPGWVRKIHDRLDWLARNAAHPASGNL